MTELYSEPTERAYKLKCKVLIKKIQTEDLGKKFERTLCFLIPEEGDQRTAFFSAWLPEEFEDSKEYFEIGMLIEPPIDSPCRGSIHRANANCNKHHIFIMSKGVEEDFIKSKWRWKKETINLTVLPENFESDMPDARDSDGSYDLV